MAEAPEHVVLIDGSGFIFRAYYGLPSMTRSDGAPVGAVMGFCNMLLKLVDGTDADRIACVFDYGSRTFRNEIYADYKANRDAPPEDLVPQFPLIREAARAFALPVVELEGYEADDIIATYARMASEAGARVTIVSSDKDMMQLVGDGVTVFDNFRNREIREAEVLEKFGVAPDRVVDVQALAGDASDNVPGVPGIGEKTGGQLIAEYGDLETLLERAGEIRQPKRREKLIEHAAAARLAKRLVTLDRNAPLEGGLERLARRDPDPTVLLGFLRSQEFRTLTARVEAWLGRGNAADYELVQDRATLERWVAEATRAGVVAVDTETTSLDGMRARLVGVSMSTRPGAGCYIPLGHRAPDALSPAPKQIPLGEARALLAPLLADPAVLKIGHNIKYDSVVLARADMPIAPVDDTMLLSYCLEGGKHPHKLDTLADLFLKRATVSYKEVVGRGKKQVTFDLVPLERARDYAAEDADVALRLWRKLKPRLAPERATRIYETIERPLIPVIAAMERAGVKVDRADLERMSDEFGRRIQALETEIHDLAGRSFAIGSPRQLGEVLFEEMGIEGGKKTRKSGAWGTGADVLEGLAAQGHDLPRKVLDWRRLAKLKSTYTDALIERIDPRTGRVHTSFSMAAASTGRLASSDPNLQNIPIRTEEGRRIRAVFAAEPGHVLLSADYSQIELRLLAHVADIDALKRAFRDGLDIHAMTASQVFGIPLDRMDPATRRSAKAINFGIVYGISAFGLARQLGIDQRRARDYIDAYFERYPGIRDYMDRTVKSARQKGHVSTLFGRKCHVTDIDSRNPAARSNAERAAINAPLQGSAADIVKRAMIRIPGALREAGLGARMLLQVHDELLFEVPENEAEAAAACAKAAMEGAARLSVPLTVDTGVGRTWAEAH